MPDLERQGFPRPRKPWYRARNIALFLLLLLGGVLGYQVYLAYTAKPGPPIDFSAQMDALIASHQPPGADPARNAWPHLLDAIAAHQRADATIDGWTLFTGGPDYTWIGREITPEDSKRFDVDAEVAAAIAGLRANEEGGTIAALREMAACAWAVRPTPPGLLGVWDSNAWVPARELARLTAARMGAAHGEGDWPRMAESFELTLALARVSSGQGMRLQYLSGVGIEWIAMDWIGELIDRQRPDALTLRALLSALDRQPMSSFALALDAEPLAFRALVHEVFTDDGRGGGRLIFTRLPAAIEALAGLPPTTPPPHPLTNMLGALAAGRRTTLRRHDELTAEELRLATLRPFEREQGAIDAFRQRIERTATRLLVVEMFAASFAFKSLDEAGARRLGVRVMLAIELFDEERGRLPGSLADLVPEYLSEVPIDPYSGSPLLYRPLGADEGGRHRYLLYSVGPDGRDDGGVKDFVKDGFGTGDRRTSVGYDFIYAGRKHQPPP